MSSFLIVFRQILLDLRSRIGPWAPYWLAIGSIVVSTAAAFSPAFATAAAIVFLLLPVIYLYFQALLASFRFWQCDELVLVSDVTRREFFRDGHVHEVWTREMRNVSTRNTADTFDFPMYWDIPLEQVHPVTIHLIKRLAGGRSDTRTTVFNVSRDSPEYTERQFEGRKFFGCVISVPLGLEPGEGLFVKLIYGHRVSMPTDDQIILAKPRAGALKWEGNANDGLKFNSSDSYVEARYPDPTSAPHMRESKRASRYLKFEEADTRMILDLPRPKAGFCYRVVFNLQDGDSSTGSKSMTSHQPD